MSMEGFESVDLRVGTVVRVERNARARVPAYAVTVDLGHEIGRKTSSAQITDLYAPEGLLGKQVVCCVSVDPIRIGSVKSEVLILGAPSPEGVVILRPERKVEDGARIF